MSAAAIKATFSDWRTVKGRKMLQLVFEVPLDQQGSVLTFLGAPDPANPKWCGIAILDLDKPASPEKTAEKPKRHFNELPLSQQAAMRCNEPAFWTFIKIHAPNSASNVADSSDYVRQYCGIPTRRELDTNRQAAAKWKQLDDAYVLWTRGIE